MNDMHTSTVDAWANVVCQRTASCAPHIESQAGTSRRGNHIAFVCNALFPANRARRPSGQKVGPSISLTYWKVMQQAFATMSHCGRSGWNLPPEIQTLICKHKCLASDRQHKARARCMVANRAWGRLPSLLTTLHNTLRRRGSWHRRAP